MEYPSLVYKDGGTHKRPGGHYSYREVNSDADLAAAESLGWCSSLAEVCGIVVEKPVVEKPAVEKPANDEPKPKPKPKAKTKKVEPEEVK